MAEEGSPFTRALELVARVSARRRRTVAIVCLVVVLGSAGVAATTVQLDMGLDLYVGDDTATAQDWDRIEADYDRGNVVFVVVEAGEVTDPATLRLIDRLDREYEQNEHISSSKSLADVVRTGAGGSIPETSAGVEAAIDRVRDSDDASRTLVDTIYPSPGRSHLLLSYGEVGAPADGGLFDFVVTKDAEVVESAVTEATAGVAAPADTTVTITGASIFETAAFERMLFDALTLFAGGFLLVFVVVYFVMRRRLDSGRQAFFSLIVGFASVVVMLGGMGVLGFDFNAIMLAVLPVGVGLSVDYALQIHTRYVAERDEGNPPVDAAGVAARTTGRALLLAMGTTVVGFGSLLASPVPPVRQFGLTAAINVAAAMLLSVTLLVVLLVEADVRSGASLATRARSDGHLERAVGAVSGLADANPLLVLVVVLPLVAGGAVAYPQVDTTQELLDYWPQELDERRQFEETLESSPSPKTVYVLVETADAYEPATLEEVARLQAEVAELDPVNAVGGPVTTLTTATGGAIPDSRARIRTILDTAASSPLGTATTPDHRPDELLLTLYVEDIEGETIRTLIDRIDGAATAEVPDASVTITGTPVVTRLVIENVTAGLETMTMLSFGAAFVFLALALRSPRASLLLLLAVPATAAVLVLGAMYLLGIPWNPGTVSMASIALGVGVDYGLHIRERYVEHRENGVDPPAAIDDALQELSRPVVGSGLTTVAGFGVLVFSQFPVVRNFGKTLVLVVALSMFAAFVVLPAAILAADGRDSWQSFRRRLPVLGEGRIARNGRVRNPDAATVAETPVAATLRGDETVHHLVETEGGELVVRGSAESDRMLASGDRSYAAVTDRRVLLILAPAAADPTVRTVAYPGIWTAEATAGLLTSRLTIGTHDDRRYRFRVGGRPELAPVAATIREAADHWTEVARHLEGAAESLAALDDHLADGPEPAETAGLVRDSLAAAREVATTFADPGHPIFERIDDLETALAESEYRAAAAAADRHRREAAGHRDAGRYVEAFVAFEAALDAYEGALDLTSDADVSDPPDLATRRERVAERRSALLGEPLRRARRAVTDAASTDDEEVAVEAWATALDRQRRALELARADAPFEGDPGDLRDSVERAAAGYIEACRTRAATLEETAEALRGGAAIRRDLYEEGAEHLRRAADVAGELQAGDRVALEADAARLEARRDSLDDRLEGDTAPT